MKHKLTGLFLSLLCMLLLRDSVFAAAAAIPAPVAAPAAVAPAAADPEWQKIETQVLALPDPRQIISPGLFDRELFHIVTFPKDGGAVDLGLPHLGKDQAGKDHPALLARLAQGAIWVDLNGDGKPGADEVRRVGTAPDGFTEPFTSELHYEDGSSAQYIFRFKTLVEGEKYALVRTMAREAHFQGKKIMLLDDDGNGKYDDAARDVVVVEGSPPAFLGKYIAIGDKFYELLVHAGGATIEIRPAPEMEYGWVDLFEGYKPAQRSSNLQMHDLIVSGPTGSFAMDETHKNVKVPVGAYDLVFGLLERTKETIYIKKGDKTSFNVLSKKVAAPEWGGAITAKFDLDSDGSEITIGKLAFIGAASEQYIPENYRQTPVQGTLSRVFTDSTRIEQKTPVGSRAFKLLPDGGLSPLVFKPFRTKSEEYEGAVEFTSGILGQVLSRQRLHFVYKKKETKPK